MRCGELLGVKWARTNMDTGELKIVETVVPVNHHDVVRANDGAGFRTIPLDTRTSRLFVTIAVASSRSASHWGVTTPLLTSCPGWDSNPHALSGRRV
jgi:hypothetical protein